jgi:hypothetical protein
LITVQEVAQAFREVGHRVSAPGIVKAGFHCRRSGVKPKILGGEHFLRLITRKVSSSDVVVTSLRRLRIRVSEFEEELFKVSSSLLRRLNYVKRGGHSPLTLAVSAIYAAERRVLAKARGRKLILTQKLLSAISGVAEYSIREHYKELFKGLD